MRLQPALALLAASLVSGCYWEPSTAEFLVSTTPPGASCVITQMGQALGVAEPTPAIAIVTLADGEIGVLCRRPGFQETAMTVPSPPPPGMPGFVPNRRAGIDHQTRVDITMLPAVPGAPPERPR